MPSILIIGEDPARIDFDAPGAPEGVTAATITDGLNGGRDRLRAAGHRADILWTRDAIEDEASQALAATRYDVIVIGAGLRTLPPMADKFERLINVILRESPASRVAFNSYPGDTDIAAQRWL